METTTSWSSSPHCHAPATVGRGSSSAGWRAKSTAFAHSVHVDVAQVELSAACGKALEEVERLGGTGGCIAVRSDGTAAMCFDTEIMYRGWADSSGSTAIGVWPGDLEPAPPAESDEDFAESNLR